MFPFVISITERVVPQEAQGIPVVIFMKQTFVEIAVFPSKNRLLAIQAIPNILIKSSKI